jgi:uncharacterized Zn-binding protein involved in type VI secretion
MPAVARFGDISDHGGSIISSASKTTDNSGKLIARKNDSHSCPIPGHGVTAITSKVSSTFICEGQPVAVVGSVCGCGAIISSGSPNTFAPIDA